MCGCFLILYPKVFHPWIQIIFGWNPKAVEPEQAPFHPRERAAHARQQQQSAEVRSRTGSFQDEVAKRQSTSRGGMVSFLLPIYAIGVIVYLGYTLMKIWTKKSDSDYGQSIGQRRLAAMRARKAQVRKRERFTFDGQATGANQRNQGEVASETNVSAAKKDPQEIENETVSRTSELLALLRNADFDNLSITELSALRKKLEDSEARMTGLIDQVSSANERAASQTESMSPTTGDTEQVAEKKDSTTEKVEEKSDPEQPSAATQADVDNGRLLDTEVESTLRQRVVKSKGASDESADD